MADIDDVVANLRTAHATAKEALGTNDPITMGLHDLIGEALQVSLCKTGELLCRQTRAVIDKLLEGTEHA